MTEYTIRDYKLPVAALCGFCRRTTLVKYEIHFKNVAPRKYPKGIWVDVCGDCYEEHEGDFSTMGFVAHEDIR